MASLTNVWLHALNALLLFAVLKRMTGPLASALVAFLFALHPLHVESVAWCGAQGCLSAFSGSSRCVLCPLCGAARRGRYLTVVLTFSLV